MREVTVLHYPEIATPNWTLLGDAAKRRGIRLASWQPHLLQIQCFGATCTPYYDGSDAVPDIVLHRTVARFVGIIVPALTMWSQRGARVINDPLAAYQSRDKLATTIVLCHNAVPIVTTLGVDRSSPAPLFGLGDGWVVVKPAHGVRGEGIEAFASVKDVPVGVAANHDPSPTDTKQYSVREHFVVQPLIGGGGRDIRAYVVGGECVAIMQRQAPPGEVRANLALGGTGRRLPLDHPAASVAVAAMAACGLDIGGVDLIEDGGAGTGGGAADGVRVLEVDAWAGFAGLTAVTGVDIAGRILDLALTRRDERGS